MKKFAANYLLNDQGNFLKNGILVAGNDGTVLEYIDSGDHLIEISGLSFLNGILMANCTFVKREIPIQQFGSNSPSSALVLEAVEGLDKFSIHSLIELAKDIQEHFPEMNIPEIMNEITLILTSQVGFAKEYKPGIFLLVGADLPRLRFVSKSRLKKILEAF